MECSEAHPTTRSNLADVARRAGVSYEAAKRVFQAIVEELDLGREIHVQGFGKFRIGMTSSRSFKTPIIKGKVEAEPRRCIRFNQAREVSRKLNGD